jgi:hypothetical protein
VEIYLATAIPSNTSDIYISRALWARSRSSLLLYEMATWFESGGMTGLLRRCFRSLRISLVAYALSATKAFGLRSGSSISVG